MFKFHYTGTGKKTAVLESGTQKITDADDILDLMVDAGYNGCESIILKNTDLLPDFFDLKTRIAGDILQKFSNYRMKLAIIGDFSAVPSKSLRDFIRESNRRRTICFVSSVEEALLMLDN